MTQVSVDKVFLDELIDLKLTYLMDEINKILNKWQYTSASQFLIDASDGTIQEAEMDAITIKYLLDQRENLFQVKNSYQNQ